MQRKKKAQYEFERTAVSMRCINLLLRWTNPRWPELGRRSKLLHCRISLIFCVCIQTEAARYEPADLMTKHDHFLVVRSINRHCYKKSSSSGHHCHWRTRVYLFIYFQVLKELTLIHFGKMHNKFYRDVTSKIFCSKAIMTLVVIVTEMEFHKSVRCLFSFRFWQQAKSWTPLD